jgi:hypothetical protein
VASDPRADVTEQRVVAGERVSEDAREEFLEQC